MRKETLLELLGNISEEHIAEFADVSEDRTKKTIPWKVWGSRVACVVVFLVAAVVFIKMPKGKGSKNSEDKSGGTFSSPTEVIDSTSQNPTEELDGTSTNSTEENSTSEPSGKKEEDVSVVLVLNQLKNPPVSMDMDVQYEFFQKLPYDVWQMVLNDFHTLMGISYDDFILKVPAKWSLLDFYSLSTRGYKDSGLEEDYRMHDYVFEYQTENSGSITIALCSIEQPLRDCFFECKNPKVSNVYGIEIMVYQYENTFFTEFKYEDVYYDIEMNGVGIEEVQELLKNILTEG